MDGLRFGLVIPLQRLHVHDEAILDVVLHHPGEGRLDLLYGDGLGVSNHAMMLSDVPRAFTSGTSRRTSDSRS